MKKALGLITVLAVVASASATLSHSLASVANPVPLGGLGAQTFDLKVTTTGTDDWTSTNMQAVISDNSKHWYNDAFGGNGTPNPAFIPIAPSLAFDTFVTSPGSYPNTNDGTAPGFAQPPAPVFDRATTSAIWFDTVNSADGMYTIARLTIFSDTDRPPLTAAVLGTPGLGALVATIQGTTTAKNSGGQLLSFAFGLYQVPEPATLSLLVLGGLVGLVRRR